MRLGILLLPDWTLWRPVEILRLMPCILVGDTQLDGTPEIEMKADVELTQEAAETVVWRNREHLIRKAKRDTAPLNLSLSRPLPSRNRNQGWYNRWRPQVPRNS